ncbi:MAG: C40 family peptidase, partial [Campylobacteraceae bacterium]|nr:C40 family peptidase [Campylobacteraceae bacterium]
EGNLVFFRTDNGDKKTPNHIGIYLKEDKFVHASTSKGVIVSSLDEPYYKKAWISGGRVK